MAKIIYLKNGMPVYMEYSNTVQSVTLGVYVKTGAKYEREEEEGISHLLEHMLFKGTEKRSSKEISEEIDNIGGHINAFTGKEATGYYVTVLSEKIDRAVDVLADIFLNSTISSEELKKEKNVVIEEIRMYEDIPEEKVHDVSGESALKGCCLANSISGSEESVKKITREMLYNYWKERYTVENSCIAVAGNFSEEYLVEMLNSSFEKCPKSSYERDYKKEYKINSFTKIIKKDTNQVHLCMNTLGLSKAEKKRYGVSILSSTLGGNMSSRLFQKIREDRGLAYSVYTYHSSYQEGGLFTAYAGTTKENYKEVVDIIKSEYNLIKKDGITADELEKSKNQILSSMVFGLETTKGMMSRLGSMFVNYGRIVTIDEVRESIRNVTVDEVMDVSNQIFNENYYSLIMLGDI